MTQPEQEAREMLAIQAAQAVDAIFEDLRDRRFLKWLFAADPANRGSYGDLDKPLGLEVQHEIREAWQQIIENAFAARPTAGIDREVEGCLLESVREAGEEYAENGFWVTCSGCYESEFGNGQGVGDSPAVKAFGCNLGCGCSECGGIGAIWDTTDYDAMAREMLADELLPTPAKTGERGAVIEECDAPARVR